MLRSMEGVVSTARRLKLCPAPVMLALNELSLTTTTAFNSLELFNLTLSSYGSPSFRTTSFTWTVVIPTKDISTVYGPPVRIPPMV